MKSSGNDQPIECSAEKTNDTDRVFNHFKFYEVIFKDKMVYPSHNYFNTDPEVESFFSKNLPDSMGNKELVENIEDKLIFHYIKSLMRCIKKNKSYMKLQKNDRYEQFNEVLRILQTNIYNKNLISINIEKIDTSIIKKKDLCNLIYNNENQEFKQPSSISSLMNNDRYKLYNIVDENMDGNILDHLICLLKISSIMTLHLAKHQK